MGSQALLLYVNSNTLWQRYFTSEERWAEYVSMPDLRHIIQWIPPVSEGQPSMTIYHWRWAIPCGPMAIIVPWYTGGPREWVYLMQTDGPGVYSIHQESPKKPGSNLSILIIWIPYDKTYKWKQTARIFLESVASISEFRLSVLQVAHDPSISVSDLQQAN